MLADDKRGVNQVISMVVLTVLVLVAIFIFWFFIKPLVLESSEEVVGSDTCLTARLTPLECVIVDASGTIFAHITVRRDGEGDVANFSASFSDSNGNTKVVGPGSASFSDGLLPEKFSVKEYYYDMSAPPNPINPDEVTIYAILSNKRVCQSVTGPTECEPFTYRGGCARYDNDNFVTSLDFDAFVQDWEEESQNADFNDDGFVNGLDFDSFMAAFDLGDDAPGCSSN